MFDIVKGWTQPHNKPYQIHENRPIFFPSYCLHGQYRYFAAVGKNHLTGVRRTRLSMKIVQITWAIDLNSKFNLHFNWVGKHQAVIWICLTNRFTNGNSLIIYPLIQWRTCIGIFFLFFSPPSEIGYMITRRNRNRHCSKWYWRHFGMKSRY